MSTFAENRRLALPIMLRGPEGRSWALALGGAQDEEAARLRVAGVARSLTRAPDDALDDIGSIYARPRAPRETSQDNDYRGRLKRQAWTFWKQAPQLSGLAEIGYPYTRTDTTAGQGGATLVWHNAHELWLTTPTSYFSACFGLLWGPDIQPDYVWSTAPGETWGDGGLWGLFYDPGSAYFSPSFGVEDLDYFKREIRKAKGAQAYPVALIVSTRFDAADALPGVWGEPATWGDGSFWEDLASLFGSQDSWFVIWLGHVWGEEAYSGGGPGLWGTPGDTWDSFEPPSGGW